METLQKFLSSSWQWIVGIGVAVAAFFAWKAVTNSSASPNLTNSGQDTNNKPSVNEKKRRINDAITNAKLKVDDISLLRFAKVDKITAKELENTEYDGKTEEMRVITLEGLYQDKKIRRRIIIHAKDGDGTAAYAVGAYNNETPSKPIFLYTGNGDQIPANRQFKMPDLNMSDYSISRATQEWINSKEIKEFFKQISEGVTVPGKLEPVKGMDFEHLTNNIEALPLNTTNSTLPKLVTVPNGKYA